MSNKKMIIEVDSLPQKIEPEAIYSIKQTNPNTYTHGMFKYPCKFIPEIPRWAMRKYLNEKGNVLDPFAGSGTTILEAVINSHDAYSTEIDDIAKLITKVKTTQLSQREFDLLDQYYSNIILDLNCAFNKIERPEINNLEHWFSNKTICDLSRLKNSIMKITNESIKDFFYVCFVSIIKKVSFADDTSPKPYVSNRIKKNPPFVENEFRKTFERYKKMEWELMFVKNIGKSIVLKGDALDFSLKKEMDLAITSPPYINAFDYGRTMRLENIWMDALTEKELRSKKKHYLGTEKIDVSNEIKDLSILEKSDLLKSCYCEIEKSDKKRALVVKKFFEDLEKNLILVNQSLKAGGRYVIVIGNSCIRKVNVESWKIIEQLSHNINYDIDTYFSYEIKNPYIRIPRNGQGGKINKDNVIVLRKKE